MRPAKQSQEHEQIEEDESEEAIMTHMGGEPLIGQFTFGRNTTSSEEDE